MFNNNFEKTEPNLNFGKGENIRNIVPLKSLNRPFKKYRNSFSVDSWKVDVYVTMLLALPCLHNAQSEPVDGRSCKEQADWKQQAMKFLWAQDGIKT